MTRCVARVAARPHDPHPPRFALLPSPKKRERAGGVWRTIRARMQLIDMQSVVVVAKEQFASNVGGDLVILGMAAGRYYGLGEVGTRVWQLIQAPTRVDDVARTIMSEYEVDAQTCQSDLLRLLVQLAEAKLIEVQAAP